MANILIVDDEPAILAVLDRMLKIGGHETRLAADPQEALRHFESGDVDLLLTDLRLNAEMNGFDVMAECRKRDPGLPTIVITAYGAVDVAVKAIRQGACDFVCKPFFLDDLRSKIEQALKTRNGGKKLFSETVRKHFGSMIGESPRMHEVYGLVTKAANCNLPVIIQGASGTGKELVAGAIHRYSRRAKGPWTAMNCAAISPLLLESEMFGHAPGAFTGADEKHDGIFIASHGGTLFLDEIGTLQGDLQVKLLRVLEEGAVRRLGETATTTVDVRVLTATNRPLASLVEAGLFRDDLMYRLGVLEIQLPALVERADDVQLLCSAFCLNETEARDKPVSVDPAANELLAAYDWPGNVRELQNAIACAATLADDDGRITPECLPPRIASRSRDILENFRISKHHEAGSSLDDYIKIVEREYVDRVVEKTGGNRSEAAAILGISRATFYRKYGD